jgi:cytochrome c peroxidase
VFRGLTDIDPPRTDYSLVQDKAFKKWVQAYAADEALFFKE